MILLVEDEEVLEAEEDLVEGHEGIAAVLVHALLEIYAAPGPEHTSPHQSLHAVPNDIFDV